MLPIPYNAMPHETNPKSSASSLNVWYPNLPIPDPAPDSAPSHSSSPQSSSSSSLLGTPYQAHGDTNSDDHYRTPNSFSDSMVQPTLMPRLATLSDIRKASPSGRLCGPGIIASPVDYHPYSHHDVSRWHNASPYYQTGADCPYSLYSPTRTQSQYHGCSCSDNDASKPSPLPSQFPSESFLDPFYRQLPVPEDRDNGFSPSRYQTLASPSIPQWDESYPYAPSHKQNVDGPPFDRRFSPRQSHLTSLTKVNVELHNNLHSNQPPGSLMNRPLLQVRVGSDRTRANSRSRRTNPNKKVFHCPISECGATITSKHNFDSHQRSHYGVKPYPCGQGACERTFGTQTEVKRHRLRHCSWRKIL